MPGYFHGIPAIRYEGPGSNNEFAFRHYNPDEVVMGKRMEEHLRFAVAYWHSFAYQGGDPFGGQTLQRPWFADTMAAAKAKAMQELSMAKLSLDDSGMLVDSSGKAAPPPPPPPPGQAASSSSGLAAKSKPTPP